MRKFLKDLLYDESNTSLDISKFCSFFANLAYWIVVAIYVATSKASSLDLLALGTGWAAVAGGSAAWILARQTQEK